MSTLYLVHLMLRSHAVKSCLRFNQQQRRLLTTMPHMDMHHKCNKQQQQQQPQQHVKTLSMEELVFHPSSNKIVSNSHEETAKYEEAIQVLNSLQSNAQSIRQSIATARLYTIDETIKYLERSGLSLKTAEQLSVIHVAGTKGKGSTCALTESILRENGIRTGFFSSPHILSTNERIRINGEPLEKRKFTKYFWNVYNRLVEKREHPTDMPAYFKFLTVLSLHVFVGEKVDVAVLEVGIGGDQDCTNILRNVQTIGITSLGLEHTELLGNTLPEIAAQKAGIIKWKSRVYTNVTQPECLAVIRAKADSNQAIVQEVSLDSFNKYTTDVFADCNDVIRLNGSLAIHLAKDWLSHRGHIDDVLINGNGNGNCNGNVNGNGNEMDEKIIINGLRNCHWPGRCQVVEFLGMNLHLDGAHTLESMRICSNWFGQQQSAYNCCSHPKVLIFNRTGSSDVRPILELLAKNHNFDMICFVPNVASDRQIDPNQLVVRSSVHMQLQRAEEISNIWSLICMEKDIPNCSHLYPHLLEAFNAVRANYGDHEKPQVLVTGSIHLLGAAIAALDQIQIELNQGLT